MLFFGPAAYCLNNFSAFAIEWTVQDPKTDSDKVVVFPTAEHLYQFLKFGVSDGDRAIAAQILRARSPQEAFELAQLHRARRRSHWDRLKESLMERILRAKTQQHRVVRERLLATGQRALIEDNPDDAFWGSGSDGRGLNRLGHIWMRIRSDLQREGGTADVC